MASSSKRTRTAAARRLGVLAFLVLSLAATTSRLGAQLRGTVTDTAGTPLAGVVVSLWTVDTRIGRTTTDGSGSFVLRPEGSHGAAVLSFERLGYRTLAVPAAVGDSVRRYTLEPATVEIAGLTVRANRKPCPNRDSPEARALWSQARLRYTPDTGTRGYDVVYLRGDGSRAEDEIGILDESRLRPGRMASLDPRGVVPVETEIRARGYGVLLPWDQPGYQPLDQEYFAWRYPVLHGRDAYHFASELFGALHTFSILQRGDGETVLAFCARERGRPHIEGTLAIASDSSFSFAEWRFHTGKPDERAGGQVTFAPPSGAARPAHLLPSEGVFWRRPLGRRGYYQNGYIYVNWVVSRDAARPALELRAETPGARP